MRKKADHSTISTARPGSMSVRTTIPTFIVQKMELHEGDEVIWDIITTQDNIRVATVRKV